HKYYISNKKDLSKRYATDAFGDVLAVRGKRAKQDIDNVGSYAEGRASAEEMYSQNAYMYPRLSLQLEGKADKQEEENPELAAFIEDCIERYEVDSSVIEKLVQKQLEKTLSKQIERYTNGH
ncbi:MAG: hypothetical protein ACI4M8_06880, partial [Christensenellales bacterium]